MAAVTPVAFSLPTERSAADNAARTYWFAVLLVVFADLIFLAAQLAGFFETHHWFDEDGPVEDIQALVLLLAFALSLWQARREKHEGRVILYGVAAMYIACCVREVELRGTGAPEWLAWPFYGTGQNIVITAIFLVFALAQLNRWRELPTIIRTLLRPRVAFYLVAVAVLLVSGVAEASEKRLGNAAEVFEEWLELNGYVLLLLASLCFPYRDRPRPMGAGHP